MSFSKQPVAKIYITLPSFYMQNMKTSDVDLAISIMSKYILYIKRRTALGMGMEVTQRPL